MKSIAKNLLLLLLPMLFYITAAAQNKDSLDAGTKKFIDSAYKLMYQLHYVPDTTFPKRHPVVRKAARDSAIRIKGSLFVTDHKNYDSLKRTSVPKRTISNGEKDSVIRKKLFVTKSYRSFDSLQYIEPKYRINYDSVKFRNAVRFDSGFKLKSAYAKMDSSRKLHLSFKTSDSTRKLKALREFKRDSLHLVKQDSLDKFRNVNRVAGFKVKFAGSVQMDSMKKVLLLKSVKTDSLRLKKYLQGRKLELRKIEFDTVVMRNGYRSRQLSMEVTCKDGDTVYINNSYRNVIIKVTQAQRLRVYTNISYKDSINEKDHLILEKMGIALSRLQNKVTATINNAKLQTNSFDSALCKELNMEINFKRPLFIEVPGNVVIILNTKYADAKVESYVKNIKADISNGTLKMNNAGDAVIKSKYGTVKALDIKTADLNLSNTKFNAGNIVTMLVVSKSSTLQLDNCDTMNMASVSDNYRVDKAGSISGNKDFGKFNVHDLKDKFVLSGANADVKINNFSYDAPFVKIDSKYADLKLPLYDQKNYSVSYEGSYKDINKLSSPTQKTTVMAGVNIALGAPKDALASVDTLSGLNKTKYAVTAGDITGKHAKVDIVCPYCNVVFN